MADEKDIYCVRCKKKLFHYDGRATIEMRANCSDCKIATIYNPIEDSVRYSRYIERHCSSGTTFY